MAVIAWVNLRQNADQVREQSMSIARRIEAIIFSFVETQSNKKVILLYIDVDY